MRRAQSGTSKALHRGNFDFSCETASGKAPDPGAGWCAQPPPVWTLVDNDLLPSFSGKLPLADGELVYCWKLCAVPRIGTASGQRLNNVREHDPSPLSSSGNDSVLWFMLQSPLWIRLYLRSQASLALSPCNSFPPHSWKGLAGRTLPRLVLILGSFQGPYPNHQLFSVTDIYLL